MLNKSTLFLAFLLLQFALVSSAVAADFKLTISSGNYDRQDTPVRVLVQEEGESLRGKFAEIKLSNGTEVVGQFVKPGLKFDQTPNSDKMAELVFIAPKLPADSNNTKSITAEVTVKDSLSTKAQFDWQDESEKQHDLLFDNRTVLRYMHESLDNSNPVRTAETYKVYHHVFDFEGENPLTKGPGGLFPHHRGLFYGFNRISYTQDGQKMKADIWHCRNGVHQAHDKVINQEAGPVLGRHLVKINWQGQDGATFAEELRELTVYNTSKGHLIEFASRLTSRVDDMTLDGDPQHAGFQFRATQHVPDKTRKQTFYIRPDGKDKPGSFRNWSKGDQHANLAWNAMCFTAFEKQYTCCYIDHPQNPKPARFSERDYGRFGSYFVKSLGKGESFDLNYRIALLPGKQPVDKIDHLSLDFTNPVHAVVVQ